MIHKLLEVVQIVPPFEEKGVCDEAEPRRDQQLVTLRLLQHLFELLFAHVTVALDLVRVWVQLHFLYFRHETTLLQLGNQSQINTRNAQYVC